MMIFLLFGLAVIGVVVAISAQYFSSRAAVGYAQALTNDLYAKIMRLSKEKRDEIVEFSELGDFINIPLRNYSSGMTMRLAFSIAAVVNPEILIVDEILSVGDAAFQEKSKKRMHELMSGGTTVLFVSHSLDQIEEMCNRVIWLEHGKVRMIGDTAEVCQAYKADIMGGV